MSEQRKKSFVHRYLDPASRLGEVLFGLVMVLSITLSADIATGATRADARQLLAAAIGCNIAWGLIDAIMYIMNNITVRGGKSRLVRRVKAAPDPAAALAHIRNALDPELDVVTAPQDREVLYQAALQTLSHTEPRKTTIEKDDLLGALVCFWLVFLSCLPAAIPFFVISDPVRALRVSNAILVVMLFVVGVKWARYVGTHTWLTGFAMVAIGLALVGAAILLGG